ncbi:23197_t:CDS:2 [Cetraspora pellucida]|uniref:23197_t:CDS:1 n=1 Tax=Cetraspora pellucida TaxID=1433469 RepID=A0A9N9G515_9GLOM|nr:23197_t:CDS:2 [Cetraspora pellucida]
MSSTRSLIPPKLSVSGITGSSAAFAQLGDLYKKLPKGPLVESIPPTMPRLLGRYWHRYIRTSSPVPILHLIVGLGLLGYALDYELHLSITSQE